MSKEAIQLYNLLKEVFLLLDDGDRRLFNAYYAGAAERAHQGTFFLDELTEMPMEMQSKLLRFTQSGVFRPVGP